MILNNIFFYKIVIKNTDIKKNKLEINLKLIPIIKKKDLHVLHLPPYKIVKNKVKHNDTTRTNCTNCTICLEELKEKEYYRELPYCNHQFHKKCIDKWFKVNKQMTCPICRRSHAILKK